MLSQRMLDAQRAINVLQALRWEPDVEERCRTSRWKEMPRVDAQHWCRVELGFDASAKLIEFAGLVTDIKRELGMNDEIGSILVQSAEQYMDVVHMLAGRGTREFYERSRILYGSPQDRLSSGKGCVRDIGTSIYASLAGIVSHALVGATSRDIPAQKAAAILEERLRHYFGPDDAIQVVLDDDVLADAVAGAGYIKLRNGANFSTHDIDVLEVHEGWVHLATSLNGQAQPVARWLAKGAPRTAATQEGLAVLMEILTGKTHVQRARKLSDRIIAIDKAENGASFLDVFEWFRTEGYDESECFNRTRRVFRGGVLGGGAPFTKDISYGKGLAEVVSFVTSCMAHGHVEWIPLLFVGKVAHCDIPVLAGHIADGMVRPPLYLPNQIKDLRGTAVLFCLAFARHHLTSAAD